MPTLTPFSRFGKRARACRANERGRELDRQGRTARAIAEYERACRIDASWSVPSYNLGLVYKYAGDWTLSLQHNQRAVELDPDSKAAWWNLGIAATALGQWDIARFAWRGAGVAVPAGEGPIDYPCGRSPIRLNPQTHGEVVWASRLDPARAQIDSIPLPDSNFRFGDIVLNDGAATGYRHLGDQEVPVFDCLGVLEPSAFSTFVAEVKLADSQQETVLARIELLVELASERELSAEDWTTSINILCKACSEGHPHDHGEHEPAKAAGSHRIAIAAPSPEQARSLLDDWFHQSDGANIVSFELVFSAGAV